MDFYYNAYFDMYGDFFYCYGSGLYKFNETYWDEWAYEGGFDGQYTMYYFGSCGGSSSYDYYDYYDYYLDFYYSYFYGY
jgi:hypothetical protein